MVYKQNIMSSYQKEQLEAISMAQSHLATLAAHARQALVLRISDNPSIPL